MKPKIFRTKVSEERFNSVMTEFRNHLGNWKPTFNNLKSLYLACGSEWKKVEVSNAKELQKEEAWSGMPVAAIDYLKSLPEWDAAIFFEITGIKC
jgi:hypothetical protein